MEMVLPLIILIVIGAIMLDLMMGDPRWLPHPVVGIGRLIRFFDKRWNRGPAHIKKRNGIFLTLVIVLSVFLITSAITVSLYKLHPVAGTLAQLYIVSTTIAIKGLKQAALDIVTPLASGELNEARRKLSMIVGRDTETLNDEEIVRGTVETVAENTTDAITAPIFWAFIGGAPLAMTYRAINTLDSMVGYKNNTYKEFGWCSARLDDVVNWLPARMTAFTLWLGGFFVKGARLRHAWQVTCRDASKHPSPNSGWSEAMVAALLGVQLGGRNTYGGQVSDRARMGVPFEPLHWQHILLSVRYMYGGAIIFTLLMSGIWLLLHS
ncbi:cobalamin biosynthesis protein CobD [Bacillus sp. A301a_S52]|jgi:adenosylcobinamide-phosphate synthase|nr:cobalamin biosynthesis protein CobD [Bacillus sp. A301a_S52]